MKKAILSLMIIFVFFLLTGGPDFAFANPDENDTQATLADVTWYFDSDGDGDGDPNNSTTNLTGNIFQWQLNSDDCDDTDASIFPGAAEIAGDGIDQDCDNIDTPSIFAGDLKSDLTGGVAPATIKFTAFIIN